MTYKNIEDERECNRRRYKNNPNRKIQVKNCMDKIEREHPEKRKAKSKVQHAIRYGKISKPDKCSLCFNTENIVGHHTNYHKPLSVIWLCSSCHKIVHKHIKKLFQNLV